MRTIWRVPLMAAAILAVLPASPALAEEPPDWAVGRFVGDNGTIKADAEVVITSRGSATLEYRYERGRTVRWDGAYRRGRLVFRAETYDLSRTRRGIKMVNVSDKRDWMGLDRSERDHRGGPPPGWRRDGDDRRDREDDEPPDWAIGRFVGDNGYRKLDAEISINAGGRARQVFRSRIGRVTATEGEYRRGRLRFGRLVYELTRTRRGIKVVNVVEPRDWMGLDRSERGLPPFRPR